MPIRNLCHQALENDAHYLQMEAAALIRIVDDARIRHPEFATAIEIFLVPRGP